MSSTYKPHPDVLFRRLEDRIVLVQMDTNEVFELNRTGARIWELLEEGAGEEQLLETLADEFEVDDDELRREVDTLLAELADRRLVT